MSAKKSKRILEISSNGIEEDKKTPTDLCQNLEYWMTNLPKALRKVPIIHLAIPGSHDSFTNAITGKSPLSPDAEDAIKALNWLGRPFRAIMSKWSRTQSSNATLQLESGIRYFDLRVATKPNDVLHFVHGQYAAPVPSVLNEINTFLESHKHEVIIMDCQHFYDFQTTDHDTLIALFMECFKNKLANYHSQYMEHLDLVYLTEEFKYQVLVVYRSRVSHPFWPGGCLPTPWPDTMDKDFLTSLLENNLKTRNNQYGYVSQFILTPKPATVLLNLFSSTKKKCALPLLNKKLSWIQEQKPGKGGLNVIICDFVDLHALAFARTVINLNLKLIAKSPERNATKSANVLAPVEN